MLTLAKPIAGGLPMGAVLVTDRIAATMNAGDHGTTFGGGPFVASVALHVLERIADPALLAHVQSAGKLDRRSSCARSASAPVASARFAAPASCGASMSASPPATSSTRAREAGLLILTAGDHTVRILPPLVTSREDLARGLTILEQVL